MRYWQSYRFVFNSPNWAMSLLLGSVCLLIPIVGQIVLIGYLFEVIDVLLRRSAMQRRTEVDVLNEHVMDALPADSDLAEASYPEFVFGRFAEYLMRGVWPFLMQFLIGLVVGGLLVFVLFVGFIVAAAAATGMDSAWPILVMYAVFGLIYVFAMLITSILSTPIYLRAGLSGDFGAALSIEFFRDFMKRVGTEVVLAELFLTVTGAFVLIGGLALCYVGLFPATVLINYARHHIEYQLYELYLERGGAPVPCKEEQTAHPERYADSDASSPHIKKPRPEERSTDMKRPREDW